jgi:hypothetical protein
MGAPRPGSGQFYLSHRDDQTVARDEDHPPLREWGANPDSSTLREIAGRKFYWHGTNDRHKRRGHASDSQGVLAAELVDVGGVLSTTVFFENLSLVELGSLLVSVDPGLLAGAIGHTVPGSADDATFDYGIHLGGGKALGLGSVVRDQLVVEAATGAARYGGDGVGDSDVAGAAVAAFVEYGTAAGLQPTWEETLELLRFDAVPSELIWYPPNPKAGSWSSKGGKQFAEAYAWFTETTGETLKSRDKPMQTLPRPTDGSRLLPIDPREG